MLSIRAGIYNKLKALAVTPYIYHKKFPQNPSYPSTVYNVLSDKAVESVQDAGVHSFRRARIQLDIFALTVIDVENADEAYFDALDNFIGSIGDGMSPEQFTDVRIEDAGANPDPEFDSESLTRMIWARSRDFYILY